MIQKYLHQPYLINQRKWDLRLYVVRTCARVCACACVYVRTCVRVSAWAIIQGGGDSPRKWNFWISCRDLRVRACVSARVRECYMRA